jgi:hypothetical protein
VPALVNSPTVFPPGTPTIAGTLITVDVFLNNPTRVQRAVTDLTLNRFIADYIFQAGPAAEGGAVIFDQIVEGDFFTARDVQEIEPLSEFPIVNAKRPVPLITAVRKWGGAALISYESARRNRVDVLMRELTRLRNTIVRKIDTVAVAALEAAPVQTLAAAAIWNGGSADIPGDLAGAISLIDNIDLGYNADTAMVNPQEKLAMFRNAALRAALPRETARVDTQNPILAGDLGGVMNLDWIVSNRVPAGEVWVLQRKAIGSISDEMPLYSRTLDHPENESYLVQGARIPAMYVTDPKAAVKITGVHG